MDKIQKLLRKLKEKEREAFLLLMLQLKQDYKQVPGVRKLTGTKGLYRVRLGGYRLIFKVTRNDIEIVKISKRDEQTYKNL
jgi:mRNA-degrading endonuclease RelE of RelBE toxin-antitoxin system